jgi:hypothetical protein
MRRGLGTCLPLNQALTSSLEPPLYRMNKGYCDVANVVSLLCGMSPHAVVPSCVSILLSILNVVAASLASGMEMQSSGSRHDPLGLMDSCNLRYLESLVSS